MVGVCFGLLLSLAGLSGGRSLVLVFSVIVKFGVGGFSVFLGVMAAGVVGGQEARASFLHWVI